MSTYSIFDKKTGLFTGTKITTSSTDLLKDNIPEDCDVMIGEYDPLQHKVDVNRKKVIEYQPPAPGPNHNWDQVTKRWVYVKQQSDYEAEVRMIRDQMIQRTDWVVTRATEQSVPLAKEWKDYRQALRDIPAQPGFPFKVAWPVPPK